MANLARFQAVLSAAMAMTFAVSASAAETPANKIAASGGSEVSTTSPTSARPEWLDHAYLSYFGAFHGPSTGSLNSPYTVDHNGQTGTSAINLDSEITAAYMINKTIGIGAVIPFLAVPVMGKGLILGDLGAKIFDKKLVSYRGLDVYANFIVQLPTSKYSQTLGQDIAFKTTPNVRYSFPASRFTVGAWTEAKSYVGVEKGKDFKLFAGPYVNYRLASNFSLNLEYEIEAHHYLHERPLNLTMYQTDLQPGVIWNITPKVMVNPFVAIFTTQEVSTDRMAVGAVVSATLL